MSSATPAPSWPLILAIAACPLLVQLLTAGSYGIFRDEYYYLACARHLAWGYVDHPPLSMALLALLRGVLGEGLVALRVVPALCGAGMVVLAGCTAAEMGGGRFAQAVAAVSMSIAGVVLVITGFFSMNALDLVVWAGAWLLLARWSAHPSPRLMIGLGVLLGLGLLNKIGVLVLGAALAIGLLLSPLRRRLLTPWPYLAGALALAIFSPHLIWQATHGWPTLEFIANAQRYKISAMNPLAFLGEVILEQQPANLLVWTVGLGWLLAARRARPFRLLGIMFVLGLGLLMLQRAKPYYAAGLFPVLFAAGACGWESMTIRGRARWLRTPLAAFLAASGIFFMPLGVPVLPVETFARWQAWTGIAPAAQEVGHTSELPQHYSDRFGWEELAREVARVLDSLAPEERQAAVIIARNYGEAGALEFWADRYHLPQVVSGHNTYDFWAPGDLSLDTVIVVGWREEQVRESFGQVTRAGSLDHPWALEDGVAIWIAREPLRSWPELRASIRSFI